ncbi:MAG: histone deacetylase [Candidatus Omnitrophota bacterium]|nr:histone deacetylase [Candidatus Omnitrophota bacterium]
MHIIYSPEYEVDIGAHVFPTAKYRLIKESLLKEKAASENDFILPQKASIEEVGLVHTAAYIEKLKNASLSYAEILKLELPYSEKLVGASYLCAGGTILTSRYALKEKLSVHLGGGFHHAYADHGEGFCVFNDIAIAVRVLQKECLIKKALVVDVDLHQGNGTAAIFRGDKNVFTFSIHQENLYPYPKDKGSLNIGLSDGSGDEEYLGCLKEAFMRITEEFNPDFAVYLAGADPYKNDQLGNLDISLDGLKERDEFSLGYFCKNKIPAAIVLGGGYAFDIKDTVVIHSNTIKAAGSLLKQP